MIPTPDDVLLKLGSNHEGHEGHKGLKLSKKRDRFVCFFPSWLKIFCHKIKLQ